MGYSVNTAGDINDDGIADLAIGAGYTAGLVGATHVIFGSQSPFPALFNVSQLNGTNGFTILGLLKNKGLGYSTCNAGDISGDNITDLVLGAYDGNFLIGASYVIFGSPNPFPAFFNLSKLDGKNGFSIPGMAIDGDIGTAVSTAGDINGDNISDLVLGAYGANAYAGVSYVLFGQNTVVSPATSTPTPTPSPTPNSITFPLTPCSISQPLTLQRNTVHINQNQSLRIAPTDLSASCANKTTPNFGTLFNITSISYAQFRTRNSSGLWSNASSFLGTDLSQGNVELIQDNSPLAPQINFTISDGLTSLPETAATILFNDTVINPVVTAINIDIQRSGTTTLTPQQFQISGVTNQLNNVVISITFLQGSYFAVHNSSLPIFDFTYYQLQDG